MLENHVADFQSWWWVFDLSLNLLMPRFAHATLGSFSVSTLHHCFTRGLKRNLLLPHILSAIDSLSLICWEVSNYFLLSSVSAALSCPLSSFKSAYFIFFSYVAEWSMLNLFFPLASYPVILHYNIFLRKPPFLRTCQSQLCCRYQVMSKILIVSFALLNTSVFVFPSHLHSP